MMLASIGVAPAGAVGECDEVAVSSTGWSAAGVAVWAGATVSVPSAAIEPIGGTHLPVPTCDGAPRVAAAQTLAPATPDEPCNWARSGVNADARLPHLANLQVSQPVGPACTVTSSVPGPLVLNVYWNGSSTWEIEWTFTGSFTCTEVSNDAQHWQIDCVPDDPTLYHCVNPGVEVTHSGPEYTRSVAYLECGTLNGGCETPFEYGTCVAWLGGDEIDTIVCWGEYQVWVGSGTTTLPWQMQTTCYSDPPQTPPGRIVVG